MPGDSTTNQLVEIYNTFCKALDEGKEVRTIFCDISKAFDRVWHKGLLFKLQNVGISGCLLQWFSSYLSGRKQRVVIPGASSDWANIQAGVPQGSILGPLLLYVIDIVVNIKANVRLFADDTSLYLIVADPNETATILNNDLETIHKWADSWIVKFNPSKSVSFLLSTKNSANIHPPLVMNNEDVKDVILVHHKHLGLFLSNDGTWHEHIDYITSKA